MLLENGRRVRLGQGWCSLLGALVLRGVLADRAPHDANSEVERDVLYSYSSARKSANSQVTPAGQRIGEHVKGLSGRVGGSATSISQCFMWWFFLLSGVRMEAVCSEDRPWLS